MINLRLFNINQELSIKDNGEVASERAEVKYSGKMGPPIMVIGFWVMLKVEELSKTLMATSMKANSSFLLSMAKVYLPQLMELSTKAISSMDLKRVKVYRDSRMAQSMKVCSKMEFTMVLEYMRLEILKRYTRASG